MYETLGSVFMFKSHALSWKWFPIRNEHIQNNDIVEENTFSIILITS